MLQPHGVTLPTELDRAKSHILSTLNALPDTYSVGEIKPLLARVLHLDPDTIDFALEELLLAGKIEKRGGRFISRRHIPKFRTLDADWQW